MQGFKTFLEKEEKYKTYWVSKNQEEIYYYVYKNPSHEELLDTVKKNDEINKARNLFKKLN